MSKWALSLDIWRDGVQVGTADVDGEFASFDEVINQAHTELTAWREANPQIGRQTMATEAEMWEALYNGQLPNAVVRHASVGEPYNWITGRVGRVEHSVRRIDALVIRRNAKGAETLWGVEIKVSAADLRHEIKTPEKTSAWAQYVDSFYFLVPPELELIALAEVPTAYGVMVGHRWHTEIKRRARINRDPMPLPLATWRRLAAALGKRQFDDLTAARRQLSPVARATDE